MEKPGNVAGLFHRRESLKPCIVRVWRAQLESFAPFVKVKAEPVGMASERLVAN